MRNLSDCRLYGILDLGYIDVADAERVTKAMIEGDVDLIQLRAKRQSVEEIVDLAGALHQITSGAGIPLIVNDHAEVAATVPVEGVHLGQDDDSLGHARKKAGRHVLLGKSTHSFEQAVAAEREGADYVGFGPIFATPTKPDYQPIGLTGIKRVHHELTVPIFCIGGIKIDNLGQVVAAGAKRVAIVSGLLKAPDIVEYGRTCKNLLIADLPGRRSLGEGG
ncbi:MAG: thiamine-phosphate pyrophosphorylase [Verrucomicrobiota bacterium]